MESSIGQLLPLLSRISLIIIALSVLKGTIPFQPTQPLWYLKLGELAADYSIALLFAITLALLPDAFQSRRSSATATGNKRSRKFINRICGAAFTIYLLLIPAIIMSYGLYWLQTQEQIKTGISNARSQAETLRNAINSASTMGEWQSALGQGGSLPIQTASEPINPNQKKELSKAIDNRLIKVESEAKRQRDQKFMQLGVTAAKGAACASLMAFALSKLKSLKLTM